MSCEKLNAYLNGQCCLANTTITQYHQLVQRHLPVRHIDCWLRLGELLTCWLERDAKLFWVDMNTPELFLKTTQLASAAMRRAWPIVQLVILHDPASYRERSEQSVRMPRL
jgi:hypothetical protein